MSLPKAPVSRAIQYKQGTYPGFQMAGVLHSHSGVRCKVSPLGRNLTHLVQIASPGKELIIRLLLSSRNFFIGKRLNPVLEIWMVLAFSGLLAVLTAVAFHFMWKSLQP